MPHKAKIPSRDNYIARKRVSRKHRFSQIMQDQSADIGNLQRIVIDPAHAQPDDILTVQETLGNRAATQLVPEGHAASLVRENQPGSYIDKPRVRSNQTPSATLVGPNLQRSFDPTLGIRNVDDFNRVFKDSLIGFTFPEKRQLFDNLNNAKITHKRGTILTAINAWRVAHSIKEKSKPVQPVLPVPELPLFSRIEHPTWENIAPVLASYGVSQDKEKDVKKTLDNWPRHLPLRGIPQLLARAFSSSKEASKMQEDIEKQVIEQNIRQAPDVGGAPPTTLYRGDDRWADKVKAAGGMFGWGAVSVPHARQMAKKVQTMNPGQQVDWLTKWKYPKPTKSEKNTFVATGTKGSEEGTYEYKIELPTLVWGPAGKMIIGTDTVITVGGRTLPDIDHANMIAIHLVGGATGTEVIVLTGIPWKYIKTVDKYDAETAARFSSPKLLAQKPPPALLPKKAPPVPPRRPPPLPIKPHGKIAK